MRILVYKEGQAWVEQVPLAKIVQEFPTPFFIYSRANLLQRSREYLTAFKSHPTSICYAVKANSNLSLLKEIFSLGIGADIVSLGELKRARLAGCPPEKILFSGVGKRADEISAALDENIGCLNAESLEELALINKLACEKKKIASISLRINPNINVKTNPHIATGLFSTKFGLSEKDALTAFEQLGSLPAVRLIGLSTHLGSQIQSVKPYREAAKRLLKLAKVAEARGFSITQLDLGGGIGISYTGSKTPFLPDFAAELLKDFRDTTYELILEPGRSLIAHSGLLLTRVLFTKKTAKKKFVIVDAGMSELIRPVLYGAYHEILPLQPRSGTEVVDVVGPICETGDFFALKRKMPPVQAGDLLAVLDTGAYGMSMASHYNSRPHVAEILIDGKKSRCIRSAEPLDTLWSSELSLLQ